MTIPGLKELSRKSSANRTIIQFISEGDASTTLLALIEKLPVGAELTAVEMTWTECYFEVRVTKSGLEKKRASHGSNGTWQSCSAAEAAEWLRPRLEATMADPSKPPCKLILKGELPAAFA